MWKKLSQLKPDGFLRSARLERAMKQRRQAQQATTG